MDRHHSAHSKVNVTFLKIGRFGALVFHIHIS